MKDLTLIPRISEKAYAMSQKEGIKTYVLVVPKSANKHVVARAVTEQFEVVVTNVRTMNVKGKPKSSYRKGQRPIDGKRDDIKKAYVTLREGDELPLFVEEAKEEVKQQKAAEKAEKVAKKTAKKAKKESK